MTLVYGICFGILSLALALAFIRLVRGPSLPDRVVALDLIAVLSVAVVLLLELTSGGIHYLDPAIVVALVGFTGTIAFSRYLERRVL